MSSFCSFLNSCLIYSFTEGYDKSLECVCKIRAPFLANESAASFPAIWPQTYMPKISLSVYFPSGASVREGQGRPANFWSHIHFSNTKVKDNPGIVMNWSAWRSSSRWFSVLVLPLQIFSYTNSLYCLIDTNFI